MTGMFACRIPVDYREQYDTGTIDAHGNTVSALRDPVQRMVFGAEPPKSTEPELTGHDRVIVDLRMYAADTDAWNPGDEVTLPRHGRFRVEGIPEDPNLNPWWQPGLVTVFMTRVEG